jgi:uncharacterized protein (TIGR02678 family)
VTGTERGTSRVERPAAAEDVQVTAERRHAARALLRSPLLHADGPGADDLRLVRRHRVELARMFADGLGYRLVVEPGAARLFKAGLGRDATRPLVRKSGKAFTPRGYALLCLTLAALTRGKGQLLVDELVAQVRSAAVDAGLDVDLDAIADRRALHAALAALVELGVLHERDGDLEHWAEQRTASLLDVRRDRLALLISAPLAGVEDPDELLDVAALPSAAGRRTGRRPAPSRRVTGAVDGRADRRAGRVVARGRNREREWFRDRLGLDVELRAEGAVAVDPEGELTDCGVPRCRLGTAARPARPRRPGRSPAGRRPRGRGGGAGVAAGRPGAGRHGLGGGARRVGRGVQAGVPRRRRRGARRRPVRARRRGLVRLDPDGAWLVHAAGARYAVRASITEGSGGQPSLFEEAP